MAEKKKPAQTKKKNGRPTKYTPELAEKICDCIATSAQGLVDICKENDDFPHVATVYAWVWKHDSFHDMYFKAKRQQAALYAEETIKLADEVPTFVNKDGIEQIDNAGVQWRKLQVATRQWHAARLMPRVYGDKKELEVTKIADSEELEALKRIRSKLEDKAKKDV